MDTHSKICRKFDTHWRSVRLIVRIIYTLSGTNFGIYTRCNARQLLLKSTIFFNTLYQTDLALYLMKTVCTCYTFSDWHQLAVERCCGESSVSFEYVLSANYYLPSWTTAPHNGETSPWHQFKAWCWCDQTDIKQLIYRWISQYVNLWITMWDVMTINIYNVIFVISVKTFIQVFTLNVFVSK